MKRVSLFIALLTMGIVFSSCSKDDDVDLGNFDYPLAELFGTWKASTIYASGRWIAVSDYPRYNMSITFNKNGTFSGEGYLGNGSGTYKLSGKTITTYVDGNVYATYHVSSYNAGIADFTITIGKESLRMYAYNTNYSGLDEGHGTAIIPPSTNY
jgi:hypothetical protein